MGAEMDWNSELSDHVPSLDKDKPVNLFNGTMVQPLRYGVRSDLVNCIRNIVHNRTCDDVNIDLNSDKLSFDVDISALPRPKDAIHFWNITENNVTVIRGSDESSYLQMYEYVVY